MNPSKDTYADLVIKLANAKSLRSTIRFKLEQAALRMVHYEESLYSIEKEIEQIEDQMEAKENKVPGAIEKKLNAWIERFRR